MYLDETPNELIGDLRTSAGLSQKELSRRIGIAPSQLSRIENGQTEHISSDILIKLSKELNVSTDYILGLTKIRSRKNYEICELGLSETAVKMLAGKAVDVDVLNCLFANKHFPYLMFLIKSYFDDTVAKGVVERNSIIDIATMTLGDFAKDNPEFSKEVKQDMRLLKSNKLGNHETEIEKIKNTFTQILKETKRELNSGQPKPEPVTNEQFQEIQEKLADKPPQEITADDVAAAITNMFGQAVPMNEELENSIKQTVSKVLSSLDNNSN